MMYLGRGGVNPIRRLVASDRWAKSVALEILQRADALHREPLIEQAFEPGRKVMLSVSRALAERVHTFGLAWFLEGEQKHRQRLLAELEAAAGFPDWNRTHFIDTAEMMAAVALGRDWLREAMSGGQLETIDAAIIRHGLIPALESLRGGSAWTRSSNNWSIVCCGGAIVAAVALRSAQPELCREVIGLASDAMRQGLSSYAPDGGWAEGPSYWEYATRYAALAIAALEEAELDSRNLGASPGLAATWRFGKRLTGPTGLAFDYGDNLPLADRCPVLGWLAARSGDAEAAAWQKQAPGLRHPFDLIWCAPEVSRRTEPEFATAFAKAGVATLRDPEEASGFFVALKGGDNSVNHAHLDLGTFVLEARGERFVSDLGRDDYALPGYFAADRRYSYLRTGTLAHNTIVVEGRNQSVSASATRPVLRSDHGFSAVAFRIDDPASSCVIHRAVALAPGSHIAIVDHIRRRHAGSHASADWRIHTKADVNCQGAEAVLRLGAAELRLRLVVPFPIALESEAVPTPPGEADNSTFTRVLARFTVPSDGVRLAAIFHLEPLQLDLLAPQLQMLHDWLDRRDDEDRRDEAPN